MSAQQPKFLDVPPALLDTLSIGDANRFIEGWGHKLGPINRPFGMQAFALFTDGYPRAVAVSASIVSATVAGYKRREVVELARLCSNPESPSMSRIGRSAPRSLTCSTPCTAARSIGSTAGRRWPMTSRQVEVEAPGAGGAHPRNSSVARRRSGSGGLPHDRADPQPRRRNRDGQRARARLG